MSDLDLAETLLDLLRQTVRTDGGLNEKNSLLAIDGIQTLLRRNEELRDEVAVLRGELGSSEYERTPQ